MKRIDPKRIEELLEKNQADTTVDQMLRIMLKYLRYCLEEDEELDPELSHLKTRSSSVDKVKPSNLNKDIYNKSSDDCVDVECHNYQQGFIDGGNASTNQGIEIAIETERERCVEIASRLTNQAKRDYIPKVLKNNEHMQGWLDAGEAIIKSIKDTKV